MALSGRCLCGQVSYEAAAEPIATVVCHCKNCQRQSGAAMSINVVVPSDAVRCAGVLKIFQDSGDSGNAVVRQFCGDCGSPIFSLLETTPAITVIKAGTLDDTLSVLPQFQVWCASAQPWAKLDGLPAFEQNPPAA